MADTVTLVVKFFRTLVLGASYQIQCFLGLVMAPRTGYRVKTCRIEPFPYMCNLLTV